MIEYIKLEHGHQLNLSVSKWRLSAAVDTFSVGLGIEYRRMTKSLTFRLGILVVSIVYMQYKNT